MKYSFSFVLVALIALNSCSKENLKSVDDVCSQMEDILFMDFCYQRFDVNNDGKVSMQEASAVHEISCGIEVTSFKGLEYFINLEKLVLRYSCAEILDLSNLTHLSDLTCESCRFLSITLPQNPNLTQILISACNITNLNLSQCIMLQRLDCYDNKQLSSLFLPDSPNLTTLYIWNNTLSSIDISKNIQLKALHCHQNRISVLDISSNHNLKSLACGRQKDDIIITVYYDSKEQSKLVSNSKGSDNSRVTWTPKF